MPPPQPPALPGDRPGDRPGDNPCGGIGTLDHWSLHILNEGEEPQKLEIGRITRVEHTVKQPSAGLPGGERARTPAIRA